MERTLWTDERVTDAMTRIDQRFDAVDRRFDAMERNFERMWSEFSQLQRMLAQMGWGVAALLLIQMITTVVAISLR